MNNKECTKNRKKIFTILAIIIFLIFLCSLFPYSGDDWAWGSSIGLERLKTFFKDYNGRYVGNLIVLVLTRSVLLRVIVMVATIFGIIYLSYKLTDDKKFSLLLLSTLLILSVPKLILRQAIVWTSGFTNYALPTVLILLALYLIYKTSKEYKNKKNINIITAVGLLVLGFCSSLFVEHITIYLVVISLLLVLYYFIKYKKVPIKYIAFFIGSLLGAILMFSNGAYGNIANNEDGYRSIPTNGIISLIEKVQENFKTIYQELILNNLILNIVLASLLLITIYNFLKNNKPSKLKKGLINLSIVSIIGYIIYSVIKKVNPTWNILLKYTPYFELFISIIFFLAIAIVTFVCITKKEVKQKLIFYLLSIAILTLPLFIVQPIGSRCFFPTYCIFILIILVLYKEGVEENEIFNKILGIGITVFAVYLSSIFLPIFKTNMERNSYILKQYESESKVIEVVNLPYGDYLWNANFEKNSIWEERFKLFLGIPKDTEFKKVTTKQWNKLMKN